MILTALKNANLALAFFLEGIVNIIFSFDEFSPLQPILMDRSGIYVRESREETHFRYFSHNYLYHFD
jgi:hypothetical protein